MYLYFSVETVMPWSLVHFFHFIVNTENKTLPGLHLSTGLKNELTRAMLEL